ncbi:GNAT family N-acetyltransferase [Mycoplasmatota bacterium WC44]
MDKLIIRKIQKHDFDEWFSLVVKLWPGEEKEEMKDEFNRVLVENDKEVYISIDDNKYIGFINVSTRIDYVEGSESSPVGYVEGIYVLDEYREKGIARKLIEKAKEFSKERGYKELGSDTELTNVLSQEFHESIGFERAEVIVHYIQKI